MSITEFLGGSLFRYGIFPLLSAGAGILLKCATRNDQYAFFKKEDMAVGPPLMLSAILTYVVITTDRSRDLLDVNGKIAVLMNSLPIDQVRVNSLQHNANDILQLLSSAAWTLLLMTVVLWGVTVTVKRWGWIDEAQLRPWVGITWPLVLGVASLMFVMEAASR